MKKITTRALMRLAERARKGSPETTHWLDLENLDGYRFAVVAHLDEENEVRAKVAYLSPRSIMTEYDIDWRYPYDPGTDETWDTEITLDNVQAARWLRDQAKEIVNYFKKFFEGMEQ